MNLGTQILEKEYQSKKRALKIFTHCYSTTVIKILLEGKKKKIPFEVFLTEVRPKFLGRRTAKALAEKAIKVTLMPDLAGPTAIKSCDLFLFGVEKIEKNGDLIVKIGTKTLLETTKKHGIKSFAATSLAKINAKPHSQDQKDLWKNPPTHIKLFNPGFEQIDTKKLTAIITEKGVFKNLTKIKWP